MRATLGILFFFCIAGASPALADSWVQVSSQRSLDEALAAYKSLQSRFPNILGNRQARIHRVDLPQGSFFRPMVGPFSSESEAGILCRDLKAAGGQCLVQTGPSDAVSSITLSAEQVKQIQAGVLERLKDPYSAKFHGPTLAVKSGSDIVACGLVNAKNSYGGYVGASPYFAIFRGGKVIDSTTASGSDAHFVKKMCRERGVPME